MNPDWLDESKTTDAEVKDCLYHELGHRKDWVFTAITLIASAGLVLTVVAALWNAAISIWGNVLHHPYTAHIDWILYGLGIVVAGVLIPLHNFNITVISWIPHMNIVWFGSNQ